MSEVQERIDELKTRSAALDRSREKMERDLAVLEDRYESALKSLKQLGIDAEKMKKSELNTLLASLEKDLEKEVAALEAAVAEGESLMAEFKKAQG